MILSMLRQKCDICGELFSAGDAITFFNTPGVPPTSDGAQIFCSMVCVDDRWIQIMDNAGFFERNPWANPFLDESEEHTDEMGVFGPPPPGGLADTRTVEITGPTETASGEEIEGVKGFD